MTSVAKQDRPPNEAGVSAITDHPFRPRRAWWERCVDCGLSEAAHTKSVSSDRYCAECGRELGKGGCCP
jgi:hypothetical protein